MIEFITGQSLGMQLYGLVLILAAVFWFIGEGVGLIKVAFLGGNVPFLGKLLWVVYIGCILHFSYLVGWIN